MAHCAFLGLGVMGYPMAGHLKAAGHAVTVWNRTASRVDDWTAQHGDSGAHTAQDAVDGADFVMICVGRDADVYAVINAIAEHVKPGATVIDHTTASPDCARRVAEILSGRAVAFLDAPISGGQSGAEAGTLSVMCGGEADVFEAAAPIMQAYGKTLTHLGPVGSGQTAKCVNQICIAGTLLGLSEGMLFAEKSGLDPDKLFAAIGGGAAQSWQMDNRLPTMADRQFDFGFALDWMRKDLSIAIEAAEALGLPIPLTQEVKSLYDTLSENGHGRKDTSALILARDSGPAPD